MSNEFKLVPVEPTDDMVVAFESWTARANLKSQP